MTKTIQKLPQIIANWLEECKNTDDINIDDAVEYYMAYASDKIIHYLNYWFAKPSNIELFTTIWNNPDAFDDSSFTYKNPDGQPLIMEVKTLKDEYIDDNELNNELFDYKVHLKTLKFELETFSTYTQEATESLLNGFRKNKVIHEVLMDMDVYKAYEQFLDAYKEQYGDENLPVTIKDDFYCHIAMDWIRLRELHKQIEEATSYLDYLQKKKDTEEKSKK